MCSVLTSLSALPSAPSPAGPSRAAAIPTSWWTVGCTWKPPVTIAGNSRAARFTALLDTTPLQRVIRDVYESFQPRTPFAMVVTDLMKLRPRVLHGNEVSWQHLVAGTAIVGSVRSGAPGRPHLFRRWPPFRRSALGRRGNGRNQGPGHRCSSQRRPAVSLAPSWAPCGCFRPFAQWFQPASRWCAWLRPIAGSAARGHLLDPRQCGGLDPRRGRAGRRIKTFHCELFCERIDADMPVYQIHRLKEAQRQQFRWAPHTPGVTIVKLKDYEPGPALEAASPYALWLALRDSAQRYRRRGSD